MSANPYADMTDEQLIAIYNARKGSPVTPAIESAPVSATEPAPASVKPYTPSNVVQGVLKGIGNNLLSQSGNAMAMFGSDINPIAKKAQSMGIPIAADIIANMLKQGAKIDETQPGTSIGQALGGMIGPAETKVLPNAIYGGARGFATGEGSVQDRLTNAGKGMIAQAAGAILPKTISGILTGFKPSKNAIALMEKGIQPTVGQGAEQKFIGQGIRKLEEASTSMPIIGSLPRMARERAVSDWDKHVIASVEVPHLGVSANGATGSEGINNLYNGFKSAYAKQLVGRTVPLKPQLINDLRSTIANSDYKVTPDDRSWATKFITDQFSRVPQTGTRYLASDLKFVSDNIAAKAKALNQKDPEAANMLNDAEHTISQYLSQHLPRKAGDNVRQLDAQYAKYKRLERAASSVGAEEGNFNPSHLLGAIKAMETSKDKNVFGRGASLLQDIAEQGRTVLKNTLGESGTSPRALVSKMMLGSAAELGGAMQSLPAYLTALGVGAVGATRPAQKYLLGGYPGQQKLADILNTMTPTAARVGYTTKNQTLGK